MHTLPGLSVYPSAEPFSLPPCSCTMAFPRRSRHWLLIPLLAVALLGGYLAREELAIARRAGARPPSGAAGTITVYFTTPELVYPDVPRSRRAPAPERALLADLEAARERIELVSFEYNLPSIGAALARAQARGVAVRLALDRESLHHPAMASWAGVVEEAGIPVSWEQSDGFLHSKFVIIDRRVVWTGSWNATINDTYRNNNNLLRISAPQVVANYIAEFERMAAGRFGNAKTGPTPYPLVRLPGATIATYFSPHEPVRSRVLAQLQRARVRIDVLAFSFTDAAIADALIARQQAGVPVRVVVEARNANGSGAQYGRLLGAGLEVLKDGNCYTMHHKLMIIDERVVITGSYNFTGRAEDVNDENLLIIDDPALARAFAAEFARVYRQARLPLRCV